MNAQGYLVSPPERWVAGTLGEMREPVAKSGRRIVVLDDDGPTSIQSIHSVPALTTWSVKDLRWAFEQPSHTFYVLTNSRSPSEREAADAAGTEFVATSRGDSTLRAATTRLSSTPSREAETASRGATTDGKGPGGAVCEGQNQRISDDLANKYLRGHSF